ncbi:MAG: hypothetical protein KJ621_00085 [Proteobacteria bacterium]|nr:hypothetical protein [Pseudomonadota bacterium]
MTDNSSFFREYFIQTRKEIDTEKRERDRILNVIVIVLGAIGFGLAQGDKGYHILYQPYAIIIEISILIIITSLFWVRRKKIEQISDRWFVLYHIFIKYFQKDSSDIFLERIVYEGFKKRRYVRKDFVLNISLSLPIYGLLTLSILYSFWLTNNFFLKILIAAVLIIFHFVISSLILYRKLKDPLMAQGKEKEEEIN